MTTSYRTSIPLLQSHAEPPKVGPDTKLADQHSNQTSSTSSAERDEEEPFAMDYGYGEDKNHRGFGTGRGGAAVCSILFAIFRLRCLSIVLKDGICYTAVHMS